MKPLTFAFKNGPEMTDSAFRLLVLLGESPDQSGTTDNCEVTVDCLIEQCGSAWTIGRVTVACDELRDNLRAPVGLVGRYVMWRSPK